MQFNHNMSQWQDEDVIGFQGVLCKVGRFKATLCHFFNHEITDQLYKHLKQYNLDIRPIKQVKNHSNLGYRDLQDNELWLKEGVDCEVLTVEGGGWKKGKIRINISVEFYPEDSEDNNNIFRTDTVSRSQ